MSIEHASVTQKELEEIAFGLPCFESPISPGLAIEVNQRVFENL